MISIAHNGQELGQFSVKDMAAMLEVGQIDRTAHYWMEGMSEWRPIDEFALPARPETAFQTIVTQNNNETVKNIVAPSAGVRALAAAIDISVVFVVLYGLAAVIADSWKLRGPIILAFVIGYCLFREAIGGQSLGKYITRTVLVDRRSYKPASVGQSLLHNLCLLAPLLAAILIGLVVSKYVSAGLGMLVAGIFPVYYVIHLVSEWLMRQENGTYAEVLSSTRVVKKATG
jgi:uncharacterized RDD family membrane protein YckC